LEPKSAEKGRQRRDVLQAYRERASVRGVGRIFGVARDTVLKWVAEHLQQLPPLVDTLAPKKRRDILELDEL
jgi:hypothetical protein